MAYEFVEDAVAQPSASQPKSLPQRTKDYIQNLLADQARLPLRAAEQAIGLPGDVFSFINQYIASPAAEAITGKRGLPYEQTALGKLIPTTQGHREGIKKVTGGVFEPKNEFEKFQDEVTQDAASLLLPVKTKIPFKRTIQRALATSLGSNLIGEAAKDLTADEKKGAIAKTGSMFLFSLLNPQSAKKMVSELYGAAEKSIPKGASIAAKDLQNSLLALESKVKAGRPYSALAPSEKFVVDESKKVLNLIHNGKIPIESAWAAKRSLSEELQKMVFSTPEKAARGRAAHLGKSISFDLKKTLDEYAKANPQFAKTFKPAEEAFTVLQNSNKIENFVKNHVRYSPGTAGLLHLFGEPITTGASQAFIPYLAAKVGYRIAKSPTLRKHYSRAVEAAGKQNALIFNRELQKLDEGLQKEKETGYEFVE